MDEHDDPAPARTRADEPAEWLRDNRATWDERTPVHLASAFYDVAGFRSGRDPLAPFVADEVGDVTGRSVVHLQCHFGLDTLALARRGAAPVTGLDFSRPAVDAARELAAEVGIEAEFVCSDVYDAVDALGGRTFDLVFTGLGALNWLPDIERWADVAVALVAPGGRLYLAEFHPIADVFADDELVVTHDYGSPPEGRRFEDPGTYTDGMLPTAAAVTHEWIHPLGSVVTALVGRGLRLELLHEHPFTLWPRWPFLERRPDGTYVMPSGRPSLPLTYSLRATKDR